MQVTITTRRFVQIAIGILIISALCIVGCTQNQRARSLGGTAIENLAPGQKLVMATWKETDLWLLTRPMRKDEVPETYEMKESSSFGILQGVVIIKESR